MYILCREKFRKIKISKKNKSDIFEQQDSNCIINQIKDHKHKYLKNIQFSLFCSS